MRFDEEAAELSPAERLRRVAAILAAGILRLHARAALASDMDQNVCPEKPPKSTRNCLEVSRETMLSVHTG